MAYEVTRSYHQRLSELDIEGANALLAAMRDEAISVVEAGAGGREVVEMRTAFMRYVGQGHEVGVELPIRIETPRLEADAAEVLLAAFEREYHRLYERTIPNLDVEILTWVLLESTEADEGTVVSTEAEATDLPAPIGQREIVDTASGNPVTAPVYAREALKPGMQLPGPAVIVEQDTTTVVTARFRAQIHPLNYIILDQQVPSF